MNEKKEEQVEQRDLVSWGKEEPEERPLFIPLCFHRAKKSRFSSPAFNGRSMNTGFFSDPPLRARVSPACLAHQPVFSFLFHASEDMS